MRHSSHLAKPGWALGIGNHTLRAPLGASTSSKRCLIPNLDITAQSAMLHAVMSDFFLKAQCRR
jgi:hypothetical protein